MASSSLSTELTAPNGVKYVQPLGLFINNEFVPAKSGQLLSTVNPTFVPPFTIPHETPTDACCVLVEMKPRSHLSTPPALKTSMWR